MRTQTQNSFCLLTGITEEQYRSTLFETGCLFSEWYWSNNLPHTWIELSSIMLQTPQYWRWWQTQWNIRTQYAFGVTGISENEKQISIEESDALFEAFTESHQLESFKYVYPDKLVFMALKEKTNENTRNKFRIGTKTKYTVSGKRGKRTELANI